MPTFANKMKARALLWAAMDSVSAVVHAVGEDGQLVAVQIGDAILALEKLYDMVDDMQVTDEEEDDDSQGLLFI